MWVDVQRFRVGLIFKAHRLLDQSTLGLRVIKKKKKVEGACLHVHDPHDAAVGYDNP